ncbi:17529_t:CDS:2, partial [Racocetra fulgida]
SLADDALETLTLMSLHSTSFCDQPLQSDMSKFHYKTLHPLPSQAKELLQTNSSPQSHLRNQQSANSQRS